MCPIKGKIYAIKNKINQKEYIGKTFLTVEERFKEHVKDSKKQRCEKRPLYSAINKYGVENFELFILGEYEESILSQKEKEFIKERKTYKTGYNATLGGDGKSYLNIDENQLIKMYQSGETIKSLANFYNCTVDSIILRIKNNGIPINKSPQSKKIKILELDICFNSISEAANFLINNGYTKGKKSSVTYGIRRQLKGERKKYLGFHFEELK